MNKFIENGNLDTSYTFTSKEYPKSNTDYYIPFFNDTNGYLKIYPNRNFEIETNVELDEASKMFYEKLKVLANLKTCKCS